MIRKCDYCGREYFDGEEFCECGGVIVRRNIREEKTQQGLMYWEGRKKYNNIDNILESKRKKSKKRSLYR